MYTWIAAALGSVVTFAWALYYFVLKPPSPFSSKNDTDFPIFKIDFKKDIVYVYLFPPINGQQASSFGQKLTTFLKYAQIPHEIVKGEHFTKGPRGKLPFVELNGRIITDSALIIDKLSQHFDKDIDSDLTAHEKAISIAFIRMLEEHLYFVGVYYRWVNEGGWKQWKQISFPRGIVKLLAPFIRAGPRKVVHYQGIGRHTEENILKFARSDLQSCAELLGKDQFFFGKSKPHMLDLVLYSTYVSFCELPPKTEFSELLESFGTLYSHHERVAFQSLK
eukprot:TRINITY_DN9056_c0_g1_i1.p1 TRINITY_DN9056_c0_g1~~TRINITY_DN9056_c0_g1_i1.p1  ORF type:complete len:291 (-),score=53.92 TRINITY_DN9056_c0_g1_i1:805-1638(-)